MEYRKVYIGQNEIAELKEIQHKIIQIRTEKKDTSVLNSNLDYLLNLTEEILSQ